MRTEEVKVIPGRWYCVSYNMKATDATQEIMIVDNLSVTLIPMTIWEEFVWLIKRIVSWVRSRKEKEE